MTNGRPVAACFAAGARFVFRTQSAAGERKDGKNRRLRCTGARGLSKAATALLEHNDSAMTRMKIGFGSARRFVKLGFVQEVVSVHF